MGTNRSVSFKMSLRGTAVTFLSTLFAVSYGYSSPMLMPLGIETNPAQMCPVPMPDFELSEFLGDWFIMEYEFASETKLTSLDCLGYKYTLNDSSAKWNTNFRNVEMVSVVVDTDYSRWAVIAQCVQNAYGPPTFQSSRILSRQRTLDDADLDRAKAALREFNIEGPYKHSIDQNNCF